MDTNSYVAAFAPFLDLVQLADHPGDRLSYRHLLMTPLAGAVWPDGAPDAATVSVEMANRLSDLGLAGTLAWLRGRLPSDPAACWDAATEDSFNRFLEAARTFERSLGPADRLSDFRKVITSCTQA